MLSANYRVSFVAIALLAAILVGCGPSVTPGATEDNFDLIKPGTRRTEVERLLGVTIPANSTQFELVITVRKPRPLKMGGTTNKIPALILLNDDRVTSTDLAIVD